MKRIFTEEHKRNISLNHADFSGINNPFYGKTHSEETKQKLKITKKKSHNYSICKCASCKSKRGETKGKNNPNWREGGLCSDINYPENWTKYFKESIKFRDYHICQLCGKTKETSGFSLEIHHIDYNKQNIGSYNLITLCKSCHSKTNGYTKRNRDFWYKKISNIRDLRDLKEKLVNNE